MRAPRITLRTTWIGKTMRVDVPERVTAAGVRLGSLPEDFFDAPDRAAVFDGEVTVVRATPDLLEVPDGPFTVEAWVLGDTYEGRRGLVSKAQQSEFGLFASNGTPSFVVMLGPEYVQAKADAPLLRPGRWHHVAGVYDGASVTLWLDGREVGRGEGEGSRRRNGLPMYVGADPNRRGDPMSFFDGRIDEVRVSTGARYTAPFEPARRHAPDDRTLLLLHLDRGLGPFAPDAGPGRRHPVAPSGIRYGSRED